MDTVGISVAEPVVGKHKPEETPNDDIPVKDSALYSFLNSKPVRCQPNPSYEGVTPQVKQCYRYYYGCVWYISTYLSV